MGMCLIALMSWETFVWLVPVALKVAIGLGAVIFVHELGHFLVAKACGVKIEKFMIGFDIGGYKLAWRRGETLYGIGILPLGGYVKMLGQDDDPSHIAEQMQKSQVDVESGNAKAVKGPNGETYYVDRRSYLAKSVPQRMAIISAGVVMNIIFAFIFAVIAYGMGVPYVPSIVSETVPGSPAWRAGLEPGDEIVQLGRRVNPSFVQLMGGVTRSDRGEGIKCVVRRAEDNETVEMTLRPEQEPGQLAMIGISGPATLTLGPTPVEEGSAAGLATLVEPAANMAKDDGAKFRAGDEVVRVGDTQITSFREFVAELAPRAAEPLQITVKRSANSEASQQSGSKPSEPVELTFQVPAQQQRDLGLVMKMGPITAIQENSPGDEAGFLVGDVITKVDGVAAGETPGEKASWSPSTLGDVTSAAAVEGRDLEFLVLRKAKDGADPLEVTLSVRPRVPEMYHANPRLGTPQGDEALGIAYQITNVVAGVRDQSTAAKSGIKPGSTITGAKILRPKDDKGTTPEPIELEFGPEQSNWPFLMGLLQFVSPETTVELSVKEANGTDTRQVRLASTPIEGAFVAARGFVFEPLERTRRAESIGQAVRFGFDETVDGLTMVVRFLQKLGTQVPITMLGGPGTIAVAAGGAASQGLSSLLIFLTLLSANLAVVNFLPIPLLDGGHIVFLAYEGIRGRPANERFVVAMHLVGFVFIVGLMLFVIGLDVQRWLL